MPFETLIKYPVVFISGLLAALLVTPVWRRLAPRLGFVDRPGGRKIHQVTMPVGGGVAVFFGFHATCAAVFLLPWKPFAGQISIDWWFRFIPLSVGVIALGLFDDRFGMKPRVKLAGQIALAGLAYALNIRIQNILGLNLPVWIDLLGTILWFVAIMNAFNLIDGLDGLATGIAFIAAVGIAISLLFRHLPGDVLLLAGFAGACLGFLRYNFYPASVFLGDTGSLFIGFTLAALTISTSSKGPAVAAIGMPLLAVGVPLFDSALAVWRRSVRRMLKGTNGNGVRVSIDQGDAEHLHHRLLKEGRKHNQVAWVFYIATGLLVATGILTTVFNDKAVGILGIAFVVTAYMVVRHLVWIELKDTGEVVLQGIARPVRRNLSLLVYILADVVLLNLAWGVSTTLLNLQDGVSLAGMKSLWLRSFPVDIVIPFLILMGFRAYSRVWSLAGVVEYVKIGMAGVLGCFLTSAVHLLFLPSGGNLWSVVVRQILLFGLAIPSICGLRALLRSVQDAMFRYAIRLRKDSGERNRILVAGCGPEMMLFLKHRAMQGRIDRQSIIAGLLSDDEALRGCYIDGVQVMGTLKELPALIKGRKIHAVYRVGSAGEQELAALRTCLRETGVRLIHWDVAEQDVSA